MGKNTSDMLIIDEVDYYIIDEASNVCRLAEPIAGMDLLLPLYF